MFSVFWRSFTTSVISRQGHRFKKPFIRHQRPSLNPGIDKRLKVMKEARAVDENPEFEDIEESEADFLEMSHTPKMYEREVERQREFLKSKIVEQKYFDDPTPNLLMWSEKEHIRHINKTDPEEWTPERIAASFPVTVKAAKKILKNAWRPATRARMNRHDASVLRNWRQLKEGTLEEYSQKEIEHFLTFSNRTIPPRPDNPDIFTSPIKPPETDEFSSIITSYEERINSNDQKLLESEKSESFENENETESTSMVIMSKSRKKEKKLLTLEELKKEISSQPAEEITDFDKLIIAPREVSPTVQLNTHQDYNIYNNNTNIIERADKRNLPNKFKDVSSLKGLQAAPPPYPEKISIPPKAWKRGRTYKVNDCYYDYDGLFLYRVPGMTKDFIPPTEKE